MLSNLEYISANVPCTLTIFSRGGMLVILISVDAESSRRGISVIGGIVFATQGAVNPKSGNFGRVSVGLGYESKSVGSENFNWIGLMGFQNRVGLGIEIILGQSRPETELDTNRN